MNLNARHVETPDLPVWQRAMILPVLLQAALLQFSIYDSAPDAPSTSQIAVLLPMSFMLWMPMWVFLCDRPMAEKYSHANQLFYAYSLALGFYMLEAYVR